MAELPGINEDLTFSKEIAAKILQYKAQRFGTIHLLLRAVLNVTPITTKPWFVTTLRGVCRKGQGEKWRRVREAIEIFCRAPILNRGAGYELPAICRDVIPHDSQYKSRAKTPKSIT